MIEKKDVLKLIEKCDWIYKYEDYYEITFNHVNEYKIYVPHHNCRTYIGILDNKTNIALSKIQNYGDIEEIKTAILNKIDSIKKETDILKEQESKDRLDKFLI